MAACAVVIALAGLVILTDGDPVNGLRQAGLQIFLTRRTDDLTAPYGNSTDPVRFEVPPGTTPPQIAQQLANAGLIGDPSLFVNYTVANGIDNQLEAGTYFLSSSMPLVEIAGRLTDSNSSQLAFRILEGWRKEEIAAAIDQNGLFGFDGAAFLSVVRDGDAIPPEFASYAAIPTGATLEGFLYPDTYLLPPNITPQGLRDVLLDQFRAEVTPALAQQAAAQGLTLYDVVILASISEREAVHASEHPQIISVYRNRLEIGMKLDADPTVQYALGNSRGSWWAQITRSDYIGVESPYNTYLYTGLPPGPIANPGIAAITAAINPADTDYLFFRAFCDDSGYHEFALTYEQHLRNGCTE